MHAGCPAGSFRGFTKHTMGRACAQRALAPSNAIVIGTPTCHTKGLLHVGYTSTTTRELTKQLINYAGERATSKPSCGCPSRRKVLSCAWPHNTKQHTPTNQTVPQPKYESTWPVGSTATCLLHHELPRLQIGTELPIGRTARQQPWPSSYRMRHQY